MRRLFVASLLLLMTFSSANAAPDLRFRAYEVRDEQQGGLVVSRIMVPEQWKATSKVVWNYGDVSLPVHAWARVESPDGSAWVEFFPYEVFYWLEPVRAQVALGARNLGMIHVPNIQLNDAMKHFVLAPYRSKMPGFQAGASRPVNGLAQALGRNGESGPAMATRIRYMVNGKPADEDVYAMLGQGNRIPYTGPQGTWYESHRPLMFAHAVGATNGQLDAVYPLLSYIATSVKVDPAWSAHYQRVMAQLSAEFNRNIARGYAQIQAAAALSKSISANNDAMLSSMQAQRQAQAQSDAARRAAANAPSARDGFSEYIRGVETMKDPYWGTSQQSYNQKYHWTDGQGNYRSSNDSGFNPNVGAGGGATWQKMEPAR
jgi:hypothetical protein